MRHALHLILSTIKTLKHLLRIIPHSFVGLLDRRQPACVVRRAMRNSPLISVLNVLMALSIKKEQINMKHLKITTTFLAAAMLFSAVPLTASAAGEPDNIYENDNLKIVFDDIPASNTALTP